jgi:NTE family protein
MSPPPSEDGGPKSPETTHASPTFAQRIRALWRRRRPGGDRAPHAPAAQDEVPPRIAFVLAGGGSRGAVQVGMLSELVRRGIRADCVFGASVGAINGAAYAGRPTPEGVQRMADVWLGVRGPEIFPRGTFDGPWAFLQKRAAVHANTGLRAVIEAGIDYTNLEEAEIPLEVVTTSLTDGRERWISSGPAVEAILASSAIPSIFPAVTIDGDVLVDGGVVDNVPISRAIAAGCNRIYVLLCGPLHYRPRPPRRPAEAALTAFFVAVHARFVRELASLPPGIEVVVFSGGGEPEGQYRDFSATATLIEEGRAEVADVLDRFVWATGADGDGDGSTGSGATPPPAALDGRSKPAAPEVNRTATGPNAAAGRPDGSPAVRSPGGATDPATDGPTPTDSSAQSPRQPATPWP